MKFIYRPVSFHNSKMTGVFRCLPVADDAEAPDLKGKALLAHDPESPGLVEKNAALLAQAFADLKTAASFGKHRRLIVPINSHALTTREGSTLIVGVFRELPEKLRPFVVVDLFDLPSNLTLDTLGNITIYLAPFFDYYVAEPTADMTDFTMFSNLNFFGVSIDLESRDVSGEDTMANLTDFMAQATRRRLKVLIQGFHEQEYADKARQLEYFSLDGPAFGEDHATLSH